MCTHSVGVGLYGQSCINREDLEEEGQLTLECIFDLGTQAGREISDPLAQGGLCDPVVFNLGITFWVGTHPQLEETLVLFQMDKHRFVFTIPNDIGFKPFFLIWNMY